MEFTGQLRKLQAEWDNPIQYALPLVNDKLSELTVPLNLHIGKTIKLTTNDVIFCCHCGRKTSKSFNQGFCFPCFKKLARNDQCFLSPEKCHFHLGTCREPDWGEATCMQPHIVYLSETSNIKVGITRLSQIPTRWIDQGATQALPIFRVNTRMQSGQIEAILKKILSDKTQWRDMLKSSTPTHDLLSARQDIMPKIQADIEVLQKAHGINQISFIENLAVQSIKYPITTLPEKISALLFDKDHPIEGKLLGIKGQYLIFEHGVINIRKFTGYQVSLTIQ